MTPAPVNRTLISPRAATTMSATSDIRARSRTSAS